MDSIHVIVEDKIPFIRGVLDPFCRVSYLPADRIDAAAMSDADALITRTRTRCDAALLDASPCRFIATATIGTDHIDLDYCRRRGITVANAPGCNAPAVAQWVLASALTLRSDDPRTLTMGIVGVGHVGRQLAQWASQLGYRLMLCDPPRACKEGGAGFSTLDEIARQADIITFHTPLTRSGDDATYHLGGEEFFSSLKRRPLVMNAARGGVMDTHAAIRAIELGQVSAMAIDTWEGEPSINHTLLQFADIATPHIAGYSMMGKVRATAMALNAFTQHFHLQALAP
ncbi:MAG: 4-phosphoerythronate dehydrogenase, partial [Muribaculaceae bacterium]|nr:4-phosphoerythronate dehydrogenase [Muribaculaceae bacterium]